MFLNAKNGSISIDNTQMDYIAFGSGNRNLIMIPGLGEGLQTVKGTALPFSLMYRKLAKDFRVYVFGRRNHMPITFTTRDMANDIIYSMDVLGIPSAQVIGISLGGMIAQHMAIDYPNRVERLILTVTLARSNPTMEECLGSWITMARKGDFPELFSDTARRSYTPKHVKANMLVYRTTGYLISKKRTARFITMARAGSAHNTYDSLSKITCPTLIIGGAQDQIVTGQASVELHEQIPFSTLYLYPEYSHGLYEEAPDFLDRIIDFLSGDINHL